MRHPQNTEKGAEIMAVSEAQKKSAKKWDAANLDRVSIAMPKGMKDTVKAAAAAVGESMNQYIIGAVEQRISGKGPQSAAETHENEGAITCSRRAQNRAGGRTEGRGGYSCVCCPCSHEPRPAGQDGPCAESQHKGAGCSKLSGGFSPVRCCQSWRCRLHGSVQKKKPRTIQGLTRRINPQ